MLVSLSRSLPLLAATALAGCAAAGSPNAPGHNHPASAIAERTGGTSASAELDVWTLQVAGAT